MPRRLKRASAQQALVAVLLLTAASFAAGWAQKLPCRWHGYGPSNRVAYSRACYSDVHVAWTAQGLSEGKTPYVDHPVEYPVLMGGLMKVAATGADSAARFFDTTSALLLVAALVVTATTALLAGPARAWDAAMVALAPGVVLHGTVNWDLAAAALAGLGLLAWARRRPGLAGVALGLGAATKLYPALFLLPLLVLCARAGRLRAWSRTAFAAAGTWALCYAIAYSVAGSFPFNPGDAPRNAVLRFFVLNRDRPADWDSAWFVVQQMMANLRGDPGWAFPVSTVNLLSGMVLVAGMAGLAVALWRAPALPRVGQAVFLAVATFALTSKVFSPQYTVWLVPLAVLARPRWLPFLGWQLLEVVLTLTRYQFFLRLSDPGAGLPVGVFVGAVVARDLALVGLMYLVMRDIRHPEGAEARTVDAGDLAGGVLTAIRAPQGAWT